MENLTNKNKVLAENITKANTFKKASEETYVDGNENSHLNSL